MANSAITTVGGTPPLNTVGGRLTLTTAVPVTTADVTAATTIYFTPYVGNGIALYNGTSWVLLQSAQISIAVPSTTNSNYDVFAYDSSGTLTLELLVWTNQTTRATALVYQDGVLCKTGALTRRYLGTFCTTGVSGQTEDSKANRFLWNYYNRIQKFMYVVETTDTWTYASSTYRQANAATANQLNYIIGLIEDSVRAEANVSIASGSAIATQLGIGNNSTSTTSATHAVVPYAVANLLGISTAFEGYPSTVGLNYLAWLEHTSGASVTFYGDGSLGILPISGISGKLFC